MPPKNEILRHRTFGKFQMKPLEHVYIEKGKTAQWTWKK